MDFKHYIINTTNKVNTNLGFIIRQSNFIYLFLFKQTMPTS